eukprot:CAMPEP_0196825336 /NCGR_PEP_ID=MMETSP1362-20130617/92991_1 /TAXON_ID=163516 /ORGANISM="Leptocylindrus danicus, Strain CCMP1856" /LENGTH=93 /DNA_ID=CAMNT_0042205737 /DNA_START=932 /DNA_END=1213 /DNA_ORIENTATION=+
MVFLLDMGFLLAILEQREQMKKKKAMKDNLDGVSDGDGNSGGDGNSVQANSSNKKSLLLFVVPDHDGAEFRVQNLFHFMVIKHYTMMGLTLSV